MSWPSARNAIRSRFQLLSPITNISWEGAGGGPRYVASGPSSPPVVGDLWCRLIIRGVGAQPFGIGERIWTRHLGSIDVEIFKPRGVLVGVAEDYTQQIAEIFHHQQFSGVRCLEATCDSVPGSDTSAVWELSLVHVSFERIESTASGTLPDEDGRMRHQQAAHGFVRGQPVYVASEDTFAAAQANSTATLARAVVINVIDVDNFQYATHGHQAFAHGVSGIGDCYLAQGASTMTTTAPDSGVVQRCGTILSPSQMLVQIESGEVK